MNNYVFVGKIVNTFGIKGELKVISDFEYKDIVFKKDFPIYIGNEYIKESICNRRVHKNNDLILLNNYNNINEVLKYKGKNIYINREDLKLDSDDYLLNDLIGMEVYDNDILIGVVIDYENTVNNVLLKVKGSKTFYIPKIDKYIKEINIKENKIITNNGGELIL